MKNNLNFLSVILFTLVLNACNKDGAKPNTAPNTIGKSVSITASLAGTWYFVKDTVEAADSYTPFVFPQVYRRCMPPL